jgi:hypothetical protein
MKLRSDALWNTLTPEQRDKLREWLLDQNLSYRETHERAQKELGLVCSPSSIARTYRYLFNQRTAEEVTDAADLATDLDQTGANEAKMRSSTMKLVTARFLELAAGKADTRDIYTLGRLALQSQEREIQLQRIALARERFEFKASEAALKILPHLEEMNREDEARELARIEDIKRKLFGKEIEGIE